eukprot:gnl/MRDRNA2_/MRDRNA2_72790_c0_seq1.p1 gnl/MRDRNA2_/MRDRNA2_72790_c0~~gnl/MRDRNA2_/MRDRNA2_72790_c0_seq1.p1  ORF type:complete len:155 (+),score=31.38 gnl/MRDRNA2_/MRDRNA2_72790_c0_seq1:87-551(+)
MLRFIQGVSTTSLRSMRFNGLIQAMAKSSSAAPMLKKKETEAQVFVSPPGPELSEPQIFVSAINSPIKECSVHQADVINGGDIVRVSSPDGSQFDFHGLWLRDSCRDHHVLSEQAGERYLDRIPFATQTQDTAKTVNVVDGNLEVIFDDGNELL